MSTPAPEGELIVRFSSFSAETLATNAEITHAEDSDAGVDPARWGVSVFAGLAEQEETEDEFVVRMAEVSRLRGKNVSVVQAARLRAEGFEVVVDEPPPGHRLVGVGDYTQEPDYERMAALFSECRRRNPAWRK